MRGEVVNAKDIKFRLEARELLFDLLIARIERPILTGERFTADSIVHIRLRPLRHLRFSILLLACESIEEPFLFGDRGVSGP